MQPRAHPLRFKGVDSLEHMLCSFDTLYYEVLDLPLHELERLRVLRVRCCLPPSFLNLSPS